jgi:hypothetical protein
VTGHEDEDRVSTLRVDQMTGRLLAVRLCDLAAGRILSFIPGKLPNADQVSRQVLRCGLNRCGDCTENTMSQADAAFILIGVPVLSSSSASVIRTPAANYQ